MLQSRPSEDEIEVNIFGGGNSYGECILIHLGKNKWIQVDSLINPNTKSHIVLDYFNKINVDPNQIELIVASHWHDDHIKGISDVYKETNASFVLSQAISSDQFGLMISQNEFKRTENAGLNELSKVVELSKLKNSTLKRAIQDRTLFHDIDNKIKIISLSPSDESIVLFESELKEIINKAYNLNLAFPKNNPNNSSVVLLIEIHGSRILLGADLENSSNQKIGWNAVLSCTSIERKKSIEIFKIPHHGSQNAYNEEKWDNFLIQNPLSALTPYGRGKSKLPTDENIKTLKEKTNNLYITSNPNVSNSTKKRDKSAEKIIAHLGFEIKERKFDFGHIRFRKRISEKNKVWEQNIYGSALKL